MHRKRALQQPYRLPGLNLQSIFWIVSGLSNVILITNIIIMLSDNQTKTIINQHNFNETFLQMIVKIVIENVIIIITLELFQ
jgi:hypothetical protein